MQRIDDRLIALQDTDYRSFQARLVPTIDPSTIVGVRVPALRTYAREIAREPEVRTAFLNELPHATYDENMLHAVLIAQLKEPRGDTGEAFSQALAEVEAFLPHVDNWAVCDTLPPKILGAHADETRTKVDQWLANPHTYTRRFGLDLLLEFFLDERFQPSDLYQVAALPAGDRYVDMAAAWYLSYALIKQYDTTLPLFQQAVMDPRVHNLAIRKAVESYRLSADRKTYLRGLRR